MSASMTPFEAMICDPDNQRGFTKAVLIENGVSWPPQKGWRVALKEKIMERVAARTRRPVMPDAIVSMLGFGLS